MSLRIILATPVVASVNNMDLDEIEGEYSQELTNSNNFFLNGLKNKEKKDKLERRYKQRLTDARERYYARIKKYLIEHKYRKEKKKKKEEKKEKKHNYDYHKNLKDQIVYNLKIFKFQAKIKTRQIRDNLFLQIASFAFKKIRVKIKHAYQNTKIRMSKTKSTILSKIEKNYNKTKDRWKSIKDKTSSKLKYISDKIKAKIKSIHFRKKKEEKPTDAPTS